MRICILTSRAIENQYLEKFWGVSHSLLRLVKAEGFQPLIVDASVDLELFDLISPTLVIFTGGESLGVDQERDSFESALLDWCFRKKVPSLGICRGLQLIALHCGGLIEPIENHVRSRHLINGRFGGFVNSFHELRIAQVPTNFRVEAQALDGSVEAIFNPNKKCLGVMWHPEREECEIPFGDLIATLGLKE